jgi:hypothetical protein
LGKRKEQEHAAHFRKGEGGKNMQLILGRGKGAKASSSFWEEWEATLSLSLYL